jgi:hypothetical protein
MVQNSVYPRTRSPKFGAKNSKLVISAINNATLRIVAKLIAFPEHSFAALAD